jgi:hypothetical protein
MIIMNIFFLHNLPNICAMMHCNKHVIKMILETTQILCSAWHVQDPEHKKYKPIYKLTHKNHPSCVWARESKENFIWLVQLGLELCKEYTFRYGKTHKCQQYIENLSKNIPNIPSLGFTKPKLAMPDMYKDENNYVESYRNYYYFDKNHMLNWKGKTGERKKPEWIENFDKMFI